jgi:hypothetical protein
MAADRKKVPEPEHTLDPGSACWCNPVLAYTTSNGAKVWLHPDRDGNMPPAEYVAEAIAQAVFADEEDQQEES